MTDRELFRMLLENMAENDQGPALICDCGIKVVSPDIVMEKYGKICLKCNKSYGLTSKDGK